ncbi:Asp-tRNA(Asn)/Glu-tRNA(Gln) amidotransferase subunit GatC [Candidatus Bathyarchaeota archaeon]|nr:Asp-tRNA(Asn)/Glu-tRNA(Gln) amidotransferase subunit GatC [Candidatus Bathyarchaeota archaeon]
MVREKQVTREQVRHLAWLSRIRISKAEERKYAEEMSEILRYFRKLDDIDTTGIPPTYHVVEVVNVMRDDEPQPNPPNQLLGIVPARKGRFVKAPRIV